MFVATRVTDSNIPSIIISYSTALGNMILRDWCNMEDSLHSLLCSTFIFQSKYILEGKTLTLVSDNLQDAMSGTDHRIFSLPTFCTISPQVLTLGSAFSDHLTAAPPLASASGSDSHHFSPRLFQLEPLYL